jgi:hypothetical protein
MSFLDFQSNGFIQILYNYFTLGAVMSLFAVMLNIEHYRARVRLAVLSHILSKGGIRNLENPRDYKNIWKSERHAAKKQC